MSITTSLAVVRIAEADVALHRAGVLAAWRGFKYEAERAATPGRVIGAGLIAGFLSGLRKSPAGNSIPLGDKLFRAVLDSLFSGFSAAMAAGVASDEAKDCSTPAPNASAAHTAPMHATSASIASARVE